MTEATETKRDRVRRLFLKRMDELGFKRQHRMSAARHDEMVGKLIDKLAYLDDEHFEVLIKSCIVCAGGKRRNEWPDMVMILRDAYRLQSPPFSKGEYAASILRSDLGARALAEGWHVELHIAAIEQGPPPSKYQLSRLAEDARENRAERERVIDRMASGAATEERMQWLEWYGRHERAALKAREEKTAERGARHE